MDDFRSDLKFDKYNLDDAAIQQPELFAKWALKWAEAVDARDRAKDNLGIVRSECDSIIRDNPRTFGWSEVKAPTEAFINSAINTHEDYMAANTKFLDTCHDVNVYSVAKDSFDQRRRMIAVAAQLFTSNYFSSNVEFDKPYQAAVEKAVSAEQTAGLQKSPRLQRRAGGNID